MPQIGASPYSTKVIAFDGQVLVSASTLKGSPRPRAAHRTTSPLSVSQSHWRASSGSQVRQKLLEIAKEQQLKLINLEVKANNEALIHLYKKFNFKVIDCHPNFVKTGEIYYDGLPMVLQLP